MKVTRRSDSGKSGHLLISVPASRVAELEGKGINCWDAIQALVPWGVQCMPALWHAVAA